MDNIRENENYKEFLKELNPIKVIQCDTPNNLDYDLLDLIVIQNNRYKINLYSYHRIGSEVIRVVTASFDDDPMKVFMEGLTKDGKYELCGQCFERSLKGTIIGENCELSDSRYYSEIFMSAHYYTPSMKFPDGKFGDTYCIRLKKFWGWRAVTDTDMIVSVTDTRWEDSEECYHVMKMSALDRIAEETDTYKSSEYNIVFNETNIEVSCGSTTITYSMFAE